MGEGTTLPCFAPPDLLFPKPSPPNLLPSPPPQDQYKTVDPKHPYRLVPGSHTDSVLFSDWNRLEPSVVATGSADQTIKLWDLNTAACAGTLRVHSSEVLSVRWHPQERSVILSSGMPLSVWKFCVAADETPKTIKSTQAC